MRVTGKKAEPSDEEFWMRRAIRRSRPGCKAWDACVLCIADWTTPRRAFAFGAGICASERPIERLFGIDLLLAVADGRTPLWVDAARIIGRLRDDPDDAVRVRAAGTFVKATYRGCTLRTGLQRAKHPDPIVRISGAIGLALETAPVAREGLVRLARDDDADVREAALTSLNLIDDDVEDAEIERVLFESLDDASKGVSDEAQTGLNARGLVHAPPLRLLLERGYVDRRALREIAARRDPGYRPILETLRARVGWDASAKELALLDAAIEACTALS